MPVYAYKCKVCEHEFDLKQRFTDDRIQVCPVCEGETRRVIHHVPVVFKGSGFYVTDNRNGKGPGKNAGKAKKESETTEKKSDQKESKSESKAETARKEK